MGTSQLLSVPYALMAQNVSGKAFSSESNLTYSINSTDSFVFGSNQLDDDSGVTSDNERMFFNKNKAAFRVGSVSGSNWDNANVGEFSIGLGLNTTASGYSSLAIGQSANASGNYGQAIGLLSHASGDRSIALGNYVEAKSFSQTTLGTFATNSEVPISTSAFDPLDRLFVIGNGDSSGTRSDALVMLKNGNTTINGSLTLDDNNDNGFVIPNTDGSFNQVLQTNGNGVLSWANPHQLFNGYQLPLNAGTDGQILQTNASGGVSWIDVSTISPFTNYFNVTYSGDLDDDFVFGSDKLNNDLATSNDDYRFFFDKSKGAFRAGAGMSTDWDDSNRGQLSAAFGINNIASGLLSSAFGFNSLAESYGSFVLGKYNVGGGSPTAWVGTDPLFEIGNWSVRCFKEQCDYCS